MKITVISDTHSKHNQLTKDLPGGDLILHCGDFSTIGRMNELKDFCKWFEQTDYTNKVFIAGNHDWSMQNFPDESKEIIKEYDIIYLEDSYTIIDGIKIYGSPWQPEFYNWAFNLPRNGAILESKWAMISEDIDILITHCPPFGILDVVKKRTDHLGCELLRNRINTIKPKINVFGHIHSGRGFGNVENTYFINAANLDEEYKYAHNPYTFNWQKEENILNFI